MHTLSKEQRFFYYFLFGIIVLHAYFLFHKFTAQLTQAPSRAPQAIKVKLIEDVMKDMAKNAKKQIVQSEDSSKKEKKEDAFLSDKDRSFDRQSVAQNINTFKKAGKGNSTINRMTKIEPESDKKSLGPKNLKLSDIGIASGHFSPRDIHHSSPSQLKNGLENGDPLESGQSATNDYVKEIKLGDFTHVNTVEYKYYGFFHRIRQKLEQFWGNSIQEKSQAIFRSGRSIASQDYVTSLQITLNHKGEIIGVKILGASGVKELDDAAIESFNQAGPFPNPPKDLLVNGKATIEWGFVVKT
jgi:protein TonB